MFSKTCEYALRAMIYIAQKSSSETKIGIKEISKNIGSPEHFIAKILQDLSRKGFLQSSKGPNGGFFMNEKNLQRSIADIVREIDGAKLFSGCGLGLEECSETQPCPMHDQFMAVRVEINQMLQSSKLIDFIGHPNLRLKYLKI